MNGILEWLDEQGTDTPQEIDPTTPEQLEAERQAYYANTIQIEFWSGEWTFQNCNDEPMTGKINGQAHLTKLLRRAMERARDEGKKLIAKNGMDSRHFDKITDDDIAIHCQEY